ncbi:ATP-binding cassette sub-family F member 3-like [Rhinophrynus dorsalis]
MATFVEILRNEFPQLDAELLQYVTDVIDSGRGDFESESDLFEAVGEVLQDVSRDTKDDDDIRDICQRIYRSMCLENHLLPTQNQVLLQAPIQLSQISDSYDADPQIQNVLLMKKDQSSAIDVKKLEKAEAKLKSKLEKRSERDSQKGNGNLVMEEASASQAASKKENRIESSGKNKSYDIRIENFDVSFGER